MPTRQREYLTRRSFRAPHLLQDASRGGISAPQEAQWCGFTLVGAPHVEQYTSGGCSSAPHETQRCDCGPVRAPHLEQYALWDDNSTPQDGQRIRSFAFSEGYSVDIA